MRSSFSRTATACFGMVLVATAALTGCSSDDEGSDATSTTSAATRTAATPAAAAPADAATAKAVTDAYTSFFDPATPAEQRLATLEKGDAFAPTIQAQAAGPQSGTSVTVSGVKLVDPTHAEVTYTLLLGGNPVLPNQIGSAVQDNGRWKVAATTFCSLLKLQGATAPVC
ncbi:hypothetical protein [Nocardia abscessus]|uniref:hypothetical protein n=1 Tax=Nocardia abscessus TaxID=120957 RepID=UPI0024566A70|nr:hypothetical protein [Nocardia abscessus]